jgi:uncharacterized protein YuzE
MTAPIHVAMDLESGACYVRYSDAPVARTIEVPPSATVAADLDERGGVIGIELVRVADEQDVERARRFAEERSLRFPANLSALC